MVNLEGEPLTPGGDVRGALRRPEDVVIPGRRVPTTAELAALAAFTRAPQSAAEAELNRKLIDAALGSMGSVPHRVDNPE